MDGRIRNMASVFLYDSEGILCLYRVGSKLANVNNRYVGSAGGHFIPQEMNDARSCVLRELHEELGLTERDVPDLKLRYITCGLKNDELRNNYYFFAAMDRNRKLSSSEGKLKWFTFQEAEDICMPASARYMLNHFLKTGRYNSKVYGGMITREETCFVELKEFED